MLNPVHALQVDVQRMGRGSRHQWCSFSMYMTSAVLLISACVTLAAHALVADKGRVTPSDADSAPTLEQHAQQHVQPSAARLAWAPCMQVLATLIALLLLGAAALCVPWAQVLALLQAQQQEQQHDIHRPEQQEQQQLQQGQEHQAPHNWDTPYDIAPPATSTSSTAHPQLSAAARHIATAITTAHMGSTVLALARMVHGAWSLGRGHQRHALHAAMGAYCGFEAVHVLYACATRGKVEYSAVQVCCLLGCMFMLGRRESVDALQV